MKLEILILKYLIIEIIYMFKKNISTFGLGLMLVKFVRKHFHEKLE